MISLDPSRSLENLVHKIKGLSNGILTKAHSIRTGKKNQCQCLASCRNPSLPKSAFCKEHQKQCPRVSPLSGWEPVYNPAFWNKKKAIQYTHNCYSYAMNIYDTRQVKKCLERVAKGDECFSAFPQPGAFSQYSKFSESGEKSCTNMKFRIFGDNPNVKTATFEEKCPEKTSKIALVVDKRNDYHFFLQNRDGFWSHKPGGQPVTNLDAAGHLIWDPHLSFLNYTAINANSHLNYEDFCSYLCVPRAKPLNMKVGGAARATRSRKQKRVSASSRRARTFRKGSARDDS